MEVMIRVITERSSMRNNDERVEMFSLGTSVADLLLDDKESILRYIDDLTEKLRQQNTQSWDRPYVVSLRKVSQAEIKAGLNPKYRGDYFDESPPPVTRALDELMKLCIDVWRHEELAEKLKKSFDINKHLVNMVADQFYDCMSGGCSRYYLSATRYLMEKHQTRMDLEVYPRPESSGGGWSNVADFLEEISDVPRFEDLMEEVGIPKQLFLQAIGET